jgi:hypothetical protein
MPSEGLTRSGNADLHPRHARRRPVGFSRSDRFPPAKSAASNPCAAFGPGFIKVEGTDTCMKIGGTFSVDVRGAPR